MFYYFANIRIFSQNVKDYFKNFQFRDKKTSTKFGFLIFLSYLCKS